MMTITAAVFGQKLKETARFFFSLSFNLWGFSFFLGSMKKCNCSASYTSIYF